MLTILVYIFFTITSILTIWVNIRIFKEPRTFNLGVTYWLFRHINKFFKTSFVPNQHSFFWAIAAFIIHSPLIFINREAANYLFDHFPLATKSEAGIVLFSAIALIASFFWGKSEVEKIFKELDNAVEDGEPTKIVDWIKKYEKYPYFLKVAIFEYNKTENIFDEVYQKFTFSRNLENQLPQNNANNAPVKKKVNKI